MELRVPAREGGVETKFFDVGWGVTFRIEGYRYSTNGIITDCNAEKTAVFVRGIGFEGWISLTQIIDVSPPEMAKAQEWQTQKDLK